MLKQFFRPLDIDIIDRDIFARDTRSDPEAIFLSRKERERERDLWYYIVEASLVSLWDRQIENDGIMQMEIIPEILEANRNTNIVVNRRNLWKLVYKFRFDNLKYIAHIHTCTQHIYIRFLIIPFHIYSIITL